MGHIDLAQECFTDWEIGGRKEEKRKMLHFPRKFPYQQQSQRTQ